MGENGVPGNAIPAFGGSGPESGIVRYAGNLLSNGRIGNRNLCNKGLMKGLMWERLLWWKRWRWWSWISTVVSIPATGAIRYCFKLLIVEELATCDVENLYT